MGIVVYVLICLLEQTIYCYDICRVQRIEKSIYLGNIGCPGLYPVDNVSDYRTQTEIST